MSCRLYVWEIRYVREQKLFLCLPFSKERKNPISNWYFSDFIRVVFVSSCILHQQWVVSSLLSGNQPQLSSQYTQERSSWSRTRAGSPSRSQCAKHSTCSHHSSNKNEQRPVEERRTTGKTTLEKKHSSLISSLYSFFLFFYPCLVTLCCF